MSELHHECGIAGIYFMSGKGTHDLLPANQMTEVSRLVPRMLLDLQNRGQLAAGISTFNETRDRLVETFKDVGSVIEAFQLNHEQTYKKLMNDLAGQAAIGHVRYATCGADDVNLAQPMERKHGCKWKWFSFAFNGQLANYTDLANALMQSDDYHLTQNSDTEVIMHYLSYELRKDRPELVDVFRNLSQKFDGAYNILFLNAFGEMVALRDPLGIRPLCVAIDGPVIAFASESVALLNLGMSNIRSMKPGEMITVTPNGYESTMITPKAKPNPAHCFFEWIYFANVASELDDRSVYQARCRLGEELAATETVTIDSDTIVVPVPDTAKAAADAMAFKLRIPSLEGLIRNRYVGRTFIQGSNRADRAKLKYTPLHHVLEGKKVLLVEDTIVRSTTMRALINHMKTVGGAKEIHVRVACPPIIAPCFYGIDMSTVKELFAPQFMGSAMVPTQAMLDEMAKDLEADSLRYLSVDALARAIDLPVEHLCRACVTGEYPTSKGRELYQIALNNSCGTLNCQPNGRTYESTTERTGKNASLV